MHAVDSQGVGNAASCLALRFPLRQFPMSLALLMMGASCFSPFYLTRGSILNTPVQPDAAISPFLSLPICPHLDAAHKIISLFFCFLIFHRLVYSIIQEIKAYSGSQNWPTNIWPLTTILFNIISFVLMPIPLTESHVNVILNVFHYRHYRTSIWHQKDVWMVPLQVFPFHMVCLFHLCLILAFLFPPHTSLSLTLLRRAPRPPDRIDTSACGSRKWNFHSSLHSLAFIRTIWVSPCQPAA